MKNPCPSHIFLALLALSAPAVFAQLAPLKDGSTNTLLLTEQPTVSRIIAQPVAPSAPVNTGISNLTTNGSLTGNVTQSNTGSGGGEQTLSIAGAEGASVGGNVSLKGRVSAPIQQIQQRGANAQQTIGVGSLTSSNVGTASSDGLISGPGVTQSFSGASGELGSQTIGVANISGSQAASVNTRGTVTGAVTQIQNSSLNARQSLTAGSVTDVDAAGSVSTNGTIAATVNQVSTNTSQQSQTVGVGSVQGGSPAVVRTDATLSGSVRQTAEGASERNRIQNIQIGSVVNSSGTAATTATSSGAITQSQTAGGASRESSAQNIQIGSVVGSAGNATTRAVSSGNITQTQFGVNSSNQDISVGSVDRSTNQTVTDVVTTNDISQSASNGGNISQAVSIGSSQNTDAKVTTRALVTGKVTQTATNANNATQTINLGSVRNVASGTITTDSQVSGDITQSATGTGQRQKVIVGGVEGR